jgi:hypothetical protein
LGAPEGSSDDPDFWEHRLAALMKDLAAGRVDGTWFDSVIVDEAQDIADSWWAPILGALKDQEHDGLYFYTDENQRAFARFGEASVPLVSLVLAHNLRHQADRRCVQPTATHANATVGRRWTTGRVRCQLRQGSDPHGQRPGRPAAGGGVEVTRADVLTTGEGHPVQIGRGSESDPEGSWRSFWDEDDLFYGHVLGCKGLERRAVVLCVNESRAADRSRERLYVGLSRATDQLVVVADPGVVAQMGSEVARRLGIS